MAQEPETTTKRAELPMRLTRLRVKNFRSIADIDIPLSPLTVLVGPNGSGKSNVVDALRFVRDVFARGLDQAVMDREGMGVIQRWGTEGEGITIGVTVESIEEAEVDVFDLVVPTATIIYEFTFSKLIGDVLNVDSENLTITAHESGFPELRLVREEQAFVGKFGIAETEYRIETIEDSLYDLWLPSGLSRQGMSLFVSDRDGYNPEERRRNFMSSNVRIKLFTDLVNAFELYVLNPAELRQPQQILRENPFDEKGRNLAAVLRRLSRNNGSNWESLRFALRQVVAGFDTLEVESVGSYLATKLIYQTNPGQYRTSYLGQESDGTIRILGLLAALLQEPSQPFISIEEPEANIHPGALAVLAGVIEEASLRSQILVTTHSPDMLDHLPVESFLVVEKVGDTTHVGPLDASQIASVRKRLFTPGELFRMEGLQRQTEPESAS